MAGFIDHVKLYTDGACRGNPGAGAIGILIKNTSNQELKRYAECIGETTNNRAEYRALIKGLDLCAEFTRRRVTCYLDSELVVRQMNGTYRIKNQKLRELFHQVKTCEQVFDEVVYTHVRRTNRDIQKTDRMVNEALEGR